ncbi:hypothetical protein D3C84_612980 [compost metagenome]
MGGDKEAAIGAERLVELGVHTAGMTELYVGAPLGAAVVEPGLAIAAEDVEERVAAEVAGQAETEAQVVRPPAFLHGIHREDAFARFLDEAIVHVLEVVGAVEAPHVAVEGGLVDRLASLGVHGRLRGLRVDALEVLEAHLVDRTQVGYHGDQLALAQRGVFAGRDGESGESVGDLAGRNLTEGGDLFQMVEISGREVAEFR